ncbi:MAG TPA: ABC transporter substrate-binding protein [Candidatus Deferrimicrobium sp.]|nr:ABC transporter substrate-binding protein [Candidatus Deferrimicrobium sp.]
MRYMRFCHALAVLSVALGILFGCGRRVSENEILIGEFSSLTGTTATFGQSTHRGLQMAVDDINNAGGVLGKKIHLLTEDTQSKPEEAATAVTKLISRDKVVAVIGEVSSSRSLAGAPICQANAIPMVSNASTNPEVTRKGDYIFRVCYIDPFQGEILAKFAYQSLNMKRVAILKDIRNDYSIGLAQFFVETYTSLGGEIAAEQAYSEGDIDFKAQLTALKAANPEAVIVPGYYTEGALIVKQARELGMTMPIIGGDGWDSAKLLEVGGSAMNNTYFSTHYSADDPNPVVQNFAKRYREVYQETPDALAALGYDAGKILFDAISRAGTTQGSGIRDALAATRDFDGVTGKITIDKDRNARKPVVIIAVTEGRFTYKETIQP